jgi:phage tail-like protein
VHNTSKSTSELPKRVIYDNIVLRKAFDNGYFIKQWANSAIGSYAYMADILIGVLDITMHNIFRLIGVRNAWVSKYQNSQLNTNSADQWFEEVALSHNGIANLNFDDSLIVVDLYDEKEYTYGKSDNFYSDSKSLLNYGSFVGNNNPLTIYDFFVNFKI